MYTTIGLTVVDVPDAQRTWVSREIALPDGGTYTMVVDVAADDPVSTSYLSGSRNSPNAYLIRVMAALVKPGDRVLDLGAFAGEFALTASRIGCDVVAVEANPTLARMITTSAEANGFDNLQVVNAAIGDKPGSIRFIAHGPWGQVVSHQVVSDADQVVDVIQLTVDDLLAATGWDTVAFAKIDIEGSELRAFAGASGLLSSPQAPALLFESNIAPLMEQGIRPSDFLHAVEDFGYSLYLVTPRDITPWKSTQHQPEVVCDYLALKGSHPADFGLTVREPPTVDEIAARVRAEAQLDAELHRSSSAWQLQFAPPQLLEHPDIQATLDALAVDPAASVRESLAWRDEASPVAPPIPPAEKTGGSAEGRREAEQALRRSVETRREVALQAHAMPPREALVRRAARQARRLARFGLRSPRRVARGVRRRIRDRMRTPSGEEVRPPSDEHALASRDAAQLFQAEYLARIDLTSHDATDSLPTFPGLISQAAGAAQCDTPEFRELATRLLGWTGDAAGRQYNRKVWEWVYILQAIREAGLMRPGASAVGFGVGQEPIPAFLASEGISVLATDQGAGGTTGATWASGDQLMHDLSGLAQPHLVSESELSRLVQLRDVDMNQLPADLGTFDIVWSSCVIEHLGSPQQGMDFVLESCRLLKPGGVAVHTTEMELTDKPETMDYGHCAIYRVQDFVDLEQRLAGVGCAASFNFNIGMERFEDRWISLAAHPIHGPHLPDPDGVHLKLVLGDSVSTSFGILIRKL